MGAGLTDARDRRRARRRRRPGSARAAEGVGQGGRGRAPGERDAAGADHLADAERAQARDQRLDPRRRVGHLDDRGRVVGLEHAHAESGGRGEHRGNACDPDVQREERRLALDGRQVGDVAHRQHLDQAVELPHHLQHVARVDDEGHAADAGRLAAPHGQALDVVAAPAEQAHGAVQDAGAVLHRQGDGVRHGHAPPVAGVP
jgi:hypothetical protein